MKLKDKIYYFLNGYIIHILIVGFILLIFGNFLFSKQDNEYALSGSFIGANINVQNLELLNKEIVKELNEEENRISINFNLDNVEGQSKLMLNLTADELDFVVLEKDQYINLKKKGFFIDIKDIMNEEELSYDDDGAISIEKCNRLKKLNFHEGNKVLAIVSTCKNIDNIKKFVNYIYK